MSDAELLAYAEFARALYLGDAELLTTWMVRL